MLKGVCEIELRDENGNIVQKTKDKNMVTDAINRLLNPDIGLINTRLGNNFSLNNYLASKLPILDKMIGGILLFNEIQEENIDNIMYDVENVVGSGSVTDELITNDNRVGTFNKEESLIIKDESNKEVGIKFVFDFATNQSNGTIRSVSLTTGVSARGLYNHKYIMLPLSDGLNDINPLKYLNGSTVKDTHSGNIYGTLGSAGAFITQIREDEFILITLTEIKIIKTKNNVSLSTSFNSFSIEGSETIISVPVENAFNSNSEFALGKKFTYYKGTLYGLMINKSVLNIYMYNNVTLELTYKSVDLSNLISNVYSCITIYNNCYVFIGKTKESDDVVLCFIDINDYSLIKKIPIKYNSYDVSFAYYHNYLVLMGFVSSNTKQTLVINKSLNVISTINSSNFNNVTAADSMLIKPPFFMIKNNPGTTNTQIFSIAINPHIKFTIDNLATPVTKTASQTMKVIYTIQDAE